MQLLFLKVIWGMRYQWELGIYTEVVSSESCMSIWAQGMQISREWGVPPQWANACLKTAEMGNLFGVSEGTNGTDKMVPAMKAIWIIVSLGTNSTWEQEGGRWGLLKGNSNLSSWPSNMLWKKEEDQEKGVNALPSAWNMLLIIILCPVSSSFSSFSSRFSVTSYITGNAALFPSTFPSQYFS